MVKKKNYTDVDKFIARTFHLSQVWDVIISGSVDINRCSDDDRRYLKPLIERKAPAERMVEISRMIEKEVKIQLDSKICMEKDGQKKLEKESAFKNYLKSREAREYCESLAGTCWAELNNLYHPKGNRLSVEEQLKGIHVIWKNDGNKNVSWKQMPGVEHLFWMYRTIVEIKPTDPDLTAKKGKGKQSTKGVHYHFVEFMHRTSHAFSGASSFFFRYGQTRPLIVFPVLRRIVGSKIKVELASIIKNITGGYGVSDEKLEALEDTSSHSIVDENIKKFLRLLLTDKDREDAKEIIHALLSVFQRRDIDNIPAVLSGPLSPIDFQDMESLSEEEYLPEFQKRALEFLKTSYELYPDMRELIENIGKSYGNKNIKTLIKMLAKGCGLESADVAEKAEKQAIRSDTPINKIKTPKNGFSVPELSRILKADIYKMLNRLMRVPKKDSMTGNIRLFEDDVQAVLSIMNRDKRKKQWVELLMTEKKCSYNTAIQTMKRKKDRILAETDWDERFGDLDPLSSLGQIKPSKALCKRLFIEKHTGPELLSILDEQRTLLRERILTDNSSAEKSARKPVIG